MRRLPLCIAFLSLLLATGCALKKTGTALPAAEVKLQGDGPHLVELKNGMTVLVKRDDRFPLVNMRLYVRTGSAFERPGQAGISHVLEHMVFKGTATRGPGESAQAIESAGGDLNAATSFDVTYYYAETPDRNWRIGLDTITDMALSPRIDPAELQSEKQVILSELSRGEDTPHSRLFQTLQGLVFQGTPYERPIIGFRDTVSALTDKDLHAYVAEHYQPGNMTLVVVGKVEPDALLARAEALFGGLRNTQVKAPVRPYALPEPGGPRVSVVPGKWNKVYLALGFPAADARSAAMPGLDVLAQVLGGDTTSRLYRTFKYQRRLVDEIGFSSMSLDRGGALVLTATLDADKVPTFWKELLKELASIRPERFSDAELKRAKLNIEDSLSQAKETLAGLAGKLGDFQMLGLGPEAEANYALQVNSADREELARLYRQYVRPERLSAAVLVPEGSPVKAEDLLRSATAVWPQPKDARTAAAQDNGKPERLDLPGGSALLLLPDSTLPYTAITVAWLGGDGLADASRQGLPALAARVLPRGTKAMSATDIEDFLSDRAADLAASAGKDSFSVSAKFPVRFSRDMLGLLRQVLTSPAWPDKELALAKADQTAKIKRSEDQAIPLLFRQVYPFLFANAPYSLLNQGVPESVAAVTRKDVTAFWADQSRRPLVVAACGQYDAGQIKDFAAALARSLGGGLAYATPKPLWAAAGDKRVALPGRNQSHLLVAFPVPGREDQKASAGLEVLNRVLAGQSGLLFRDMRDRQGLAYTVTSFLWQMQKAGFLAFYIGTEPDKVDRSMQGFRLAASELSRTPLPGRELERARNLLESEYYQSHQSLLARSGEAAGLALHGLPSDQERQLIETARAVTPDEVRALAARVFDWSRAYSILLGPQ